jgi:solute:Na+ symporter, SSS family
MTLAWLDYLVIAGYLLAITAFGSWFARFQKTTRDYFLTDRTVPWWAICFTVVATETSTLSFIGVPAQAFAGNMTFLQLALGYIVGRLLVSVLFIPAYFRGDLYTSYELLQRRFGPAVKNIAAVMFVVTRTLADGVRLFATALVITVVTEVPVPWTVVIIGLGMVVYTTRGGVSAVIWTDVVQMFVYIAGAAVILFALLHQINGGWDVVRAAAEAAGKFTVFDFSTDPRRTYTFWAGIFGGVALTLATHGTDQFLVQRLLSARSPASAASGLILSGFIVFAQFTVFLFIGVLLFVFYQQTPLPRPLTTNDEVLPLFVVTSLSHGAAGFIVAAIVAAALSPSINALAATTVNDFYLKYVRPDADQPTLMRVSRGATIFWGVAQIGVALGAQWIRSVLDAGLAVLSLAAGPVLGAFLVGVLTTRVGSRAMVAGMLTGIGVLIWVWYTAATAWTWYAFIGSAATFTTAVVASYFLPDPVRAHLQPEPDA